MVGQSSRNRLVILLLVIIVIILLIVVIIVVRRPCDCNVVGPVTPPVEEVIVDGKTGDKQGGGTGINPDLPGKGDSNIPPVGGPAGDKPGTDTVQPGDPDKLVDQYGDGAKPATGDLEGVTEPNIPMKDVPTVVNTGQYGRLRLLISDTGTLELTKAMSIEGDLQASQTIDGDFLYVVYQGEQVVFLGTFLNPLGGIGSFQTTEGHSHFNRPQGTVTVSIPGSVLDPAGLPNIRIAVYQLDPSLDLTTPLTVDNLSRILETAKQFGEINSDTLTRFLQEGGSQ